MSPETGAPEEKEFTEAKKSMILFFAMSLGKYCACCLLFHRSNCQNYHIWKLMNYLAVIYSSKSKLFFDATCSIRTCSRDWDIAQKHLHQILTENFRPVVGFVLVDYNGTVFSYGQTGTGIIPNSFAYIFRHISKNPAFKFLIRVSYLEIYCEEIRDLLGKWFIFIEFDLV